MRLCFGFIAANAVAEEAARWLLGRGGLASSQVRKYSVVNGVHAVVDCCCTLCTTVLVVKRMQCILFTRRYRMLYTVYKGTPS